MPDSGVRARVPSNGLPRDLRELAKTAEGVADVQEEAQAVRADGPVVGQDEHVLEEPVEERAELGSGFDRGIEVTGVEGGCDLRVDALERLRDLGLRVLDEQGRFELLGSALLLLREPAPPPVRA